MPPKRRLRVSHACDFCARRSIKCRTEPGSTKCSNCHDFDLQCTYDRPTKRRGPKGNQNNETLPQNENEPATISQLHKLVNIPEDIDHENLGRGWKAFALASGNAIKELLDIYFEVLYPIFPFFHRSTLMKRVSDLEYISNRGFFASVMAACALSATRLRDGGCYNIHNNTSNMNLMPEPFFAAAKDAIPKDLTQARGIDFLRASVLVSLASVQDGQQKSQMHYLGLYQTLSTLEGFSNESNWPPCSRSELEERRSLFWSAYTFEVFSSTVWGGIIRTRESQTQVCYPRDEGWVRGWNFVTDLYRILEHAIDFYRHNRTQIKPVLALYETIPPNGVILQQVRDMFFNLPDAFKKYPSIYSKDNVYGFQSTNIEGTLALVRLVIFSSEEADAERKCDIAGELLDVFGQIPAAYLKAMGSLLLHQLAGIGSILSSAIESSLTESSYNRARSLLLNMSELLENLEAGSHRVSGASAKVRDHIGRLDNAVKARHQDGLGDIPTSATSGTEIADEEDVGNSNEFDPNFWQFPGEPLDWPWSVGITQSGLDFMIPPLAMD